MIYDAINRQFQKVIPRNYIQRFFRLDTRFFIMLLQNKIVAVCLTFR